MNDLTPEVSSGRKFTAIWIIPLVALAIGVYMIVHTQLTEGPEITIIFDNAEGLEAGKTKIRYRNVDIGLVESVTLSEALDTIVVTAKLDLDAKPMLKEDTRFWVVRARVGSGGVSGIGTLLSGAYLQLDPGSGKDGKREFLGLEVPPLTPGDAPGVRLVLQSEQAGSVSAGDAILYNGYKVGRIEGVHLDVEKKDVRYDAFIDAPYDDLVTTSTRFWNISGVEVDASAAGITVNTGSLETIILGGVALGNLPGMPPGEKAVSGAVYKLSASYQEVTQDPYKHRLYYVAEFAQSLRGLNPGAPVEYRGIRIGTVEQIMIKEMADQGDTDTGEPIPVLFYLEPGRLGVGDSQQAVERVRKNIAAGVTKGMRFSLQTGNLITGALYLSVDWYKDEDAAVLGEFDGYPTVPTIPSGLGRLEKQLGDLLDKLNAVPLTPLVNSANTALHTMDGALASLTEALDSLRVILDKDGAKALPGELSQTLEELREKLAELSTGSPVGQSLSDSVFELNRTLRNLEALTRTLSEQPNKLVFPTDVSVDPIPEASPQ